LFLAVLAICRTLNFLLCYLRVLLIPPANKLEIINLINYFTLKQNNNNMSDFLNDPFDDEEFDDEEELLEEADYLTNLLKLHEYYDSLKENPFTVDLESLEEYITLAMEVDEHEIGLELSEIYLRYSPYDSDIWQKKGIFHINNEEYERAIEALNHAYSLNPTDTDTLIYLFNAHYQNDDYELAKRYLNLVKELNPSDEEIQNYYIENLIEIDPQQAISYLKDILQTDPENIDALSQIAEAHKKIYKMNDAVFYYEKLLELEPYNPTTWLKLSEIYIDLGEYEKAIEYVNNANAIGEEIPTSYLMLGNLFFDHEKYKDAIEFYKKYLEFDPSNLEATFNLGVSYEALEDYNNAIKYFTEAMKYDDTKINSALLSRGYCYLKVKDYQRAEDDFIKFIDLHPNAADGYIGMSRLLYKIGKKEDSIKFLLTAKDYDPYHPVVLFDLSILFFETNDTSKALSYINKTISLEPDWADAHFLKAKILFKMNIFEKALEALQTSYDLDASLKKKFEKEFPKIAESKQYKEKFVN